MPIDAARLWQQVALGEDTDLELQEVEFRGGKVSAPRRDALAEEMAAFGNAGGGWVVLGVTDDRQPQALDSSRLDALTSLVAEIYTDSIKPPLDYRVFRVPGPEPGNGGALVVDIPESVTVHRSPGGYWLRRGDRKRQMASAEIRRLSQARGQSDTASTDMQAVRGTGINSLRPELWRLYVSSRADEPAEVALAKLKFMKDDSHGTLRATVGGVLLAAEDPSEWLPNAWIQAVCYRGDRADASRQVDAPGHHRPARPADSGGDALRGRQPARRGIQGSGAHRRTAVQRPRSLRGGGQRGGAPRLRGIRIADTPVHVR